MTRKLQIVRGSGNVFRDLGHPNTDVEQIKAILAARIIIALDARKLTVRAAQELTGVAAADFSRVRRVKLDRFTIDRLVTTLNKLDHRVNVSVSVRRRVASFSVVNRMSEPFKKKTFAEARKILNDLCLELDRKEASTNKTVSGQRNEDGLHEAWWVENDETSPPFDSPRCKAYLRAYAEIAGPVFYGSGIPLDRGGLMHPDRGVMKAMLQSGCVTLGKTKRGLFELTQKGQELIAQ